jgi:hypothetical protein
MDQEQRAKLERELQTLEKKYGKEIVEYFRDDLYRAWFEYLREAQLTDDPHIKSLLEKSKGYYRPWGDLRTTTFEQWIGGMDRFFAEEEVRVIFPNQRPAYKGSVVIEVPLNKPEDLLLQDIRTVFRMEHIKRQLNGEPKARRNPTKSKYLPSSYTHYRAADLLKMLAVSRLAKAVRKKEPTLKGRQLLQAIAVHARQTGASLPRELSIKETDDSAGRPKHRRVVKQLNRYISAGEKILKNTASGVFPGKH